MPELVNATPMDTDTRFVAGGLTLTSELWEIEGGAEHWTHSVAYTCCSTEEAYRTAEAACDAAERHGCLRDGA